jgi:hypothetical protein
MKVAIWTGKVEPVRCTVRVVVDTDEATVSCEELCRDALDGDSWQPFPEEDEVIALRAFAVEIAQTCSTAVTVGQEMIKEGACE